MDRHIEVDTLCPLLREIAARTARCTNTVNPAESRTSRSVPRPERTFRLCVPLPYTLPAHSHLPQVSVTPTSQVRSNVLDRAGASGVQWSSAATAAAGHGATAGVALRDGVGSREGRTDSAPLGVWNPVTGRAQESCIRLAGRRGLDQWSRECLTPPPATVALCSNRVRPPRLIRRRPARPMPSQPPRRQPRRLWSPPRPPLDRRRRELARASWSGTD